MEELRLGFLSSHGGTNMQAIIEACQDGRLNARLCVAISNNSRSTALERAEHAGVPAYHLSGKTHADADELDRAILGTLERYVVNLVVLAGYMKLLGPKTVSRYRGRILNIHPALLPKYGGRGMYGAAVHEAVLAAGVQFSGSTIHLVDEEFDHGPIVAQRRVPVAVDDTVESLSDRVRISEHQLYVDTLRKIERGEIDLDKIGGPRARQ